MASYVNFIHMINNLLGSGCTSPQHQGFYSLCGTPEILSLHTSVEIKNIREFDTQNSKLV